MGEASSVLEVPIGDESAWKRLSLNGVALEEEAVKQSARPRPGSRDQEVSRRFTSLPVAHHVQWLKLRWLPGLTDAVRISYVAVSSCSKEACCIQVQSLIEELECEKTFYNEVSQCWFWLVGLSWLIGLGRSWTGVGAFGGGSGSRGCGCWKPNVSERFR